MDTTVSTTQTEAKNEGNIQKLCNLIATKSDMIFRNNYVFWISFIILGPIFAISVVYTKSR